MSINVTVTGNPVSIKKGKMVTADPDYAKKEFQRRRRMRLEQVRQQSKDIAEDVRSKVRKEKSKQLSEIEQVGASKLKEWQSRKLLELQQQYCESLKDIGLGHTAAAVEETREDLVSAYKDVLREKSKERGYVAAKQLHDEKENNASAKAFKTQHKKDVKYLENARSAMVSKIKAKTKNSPFKKKKHKKPATNINISRVVDESDSCLDSEVSVEEEQSDDSSRRKLKSDDTEDVTTASTLSKTESPKKSRITYAKQTIKKKRKSSPRRNRTPPGTPEAERPRPPIKHPQRAPSPPERHFNFPPDTRISDRIKRRLNIPLGQPISRNYLQENFIGKVTQSSPTMDETSTQTKLQPLGAPLESNSDSQVAFCQSCSRPSLDGARKSKENIRKENTRPSDVRRPCDDIPEKPRVALKSSSKTSKFDGGDFNKVQYYDHANRYSKEYLCDNSCVRKIQDDSVQICPSTSSEQEFVERIYKRDRDALERGKKAMEKEKIHRDYKEMMRQLPILQRQERIASINSNNPLFHMSDERLKLYELKRQNVMEEAYERCFPKASLITLPKKRHDVQTEPFRTVDVDADLHPAQNLAATWDVDFFGRDVIVTKDDGLISVSAETTQDQTTEYLKKLLERLKMQKETLMREADSLPEGSNLRNLIQETEDAEESKETRWRSDLRESRDGAKKKAASSVAEDDECYCPDAGRSKGPTRKVSDHHLRAKHKILVNSSNSSSSPSPRKKPKHKRYTLILQNTSTQTTPKKSPPTSPKSLEARRPPQKQTISSDTKHFEVQIGEVRSKSPKKKLPAKKIASSQTDFTHIKALSSATSEADRVDSTAAPFKADEKDKKTKTKESRALPPRSKHSKDNYTSPPCECSDEVCEILIKIKDDEPEIVIKSPKKVQKPLLVKADIQKNIKKKPQTRKQLQFQTTERPSGDKSKSDATVKTTSWKEYFSRNNSLGTSTSTSYYSPPDFCSTKNNLREQLDPRLLTYIKKLLSMSRASIEDLGVSSVSEISTPTPPSLASNDPLNQLRNIVRYFNLNPEELVRCLNYSNESDDNNTRTGNSTSSSGLFIGGRKYGSSRGPDASGSNASDRRSSSTTDGSTSVKSRSESQKYKAISTRIEKIVEQTARNIEGSDARLGGAHTEQNYPGGVLSQYTKVAEMCHQRISNLSEMIEKVRQEKQQMLSPNVSDKENSTSYMKLPPAATSEDATARPDTINVSSGSEAEQSELTRKLLEIDYSLANKLQKSSATPTQLKKQVEESNEPKTEPFEDIDVDLIRRYKALLNDDDDVPCKGGADETDRITTDEQSAADVPFVPLLLDIPRLPKLKLSSKKGDPDENEESTIQDALNRSESKPPPSKGLSAAKKFNNDITGVPHELSTIAEVDSQLSTKARRRSTSPTTDRQVFDSIKPLVVPPNPQDSIWTALSEESLPDILAEVAEQAPQSQSSDSKQEAKQKKEEQGEAKQRRKPPTRKQLNAYQMSQVIADQSTTDSSTDKSELENVETMLKSMGMGWAVATIRKTQEALTRASSSSSSLELSAKKPDKSNSSDVSLRLFLDNKIFNGSSDNTTGSKKTTDSSLSPFLRELQEISAIRGSGGSSETKNQRTSTPVHTTKSSDKSKNESQKGGVFPVESDLSSVKSKPDDMFVTIPSDISTTAGSQSKSSDL